MTTRIPTRLDRYPAKMVNRLADDLIRRYAVGARSLLDPFCGSGAVLLAGMRSGICTTGVDINPVAALHSHVKLSGFSPTKAMALAHDLVRVSQGTSRTLPIRWPDKCYWFTPLTLHKYERLRFASRKLCLNESDDGMAVLLCFALSIRLCSRADQRSPKPFISKHAIADRKCRHFDPYRMIPKLLGELGECYCKQSPNGSGRFVLADITSDTNLRRRIGVHSHVITSPPYVNAQDYFRNFKLELYLLEDVLPFQVDSLKERFIGTERGDLLAGISQERIQDQRERVPQMKALARTSHRYEAILHRYLSDMGDAFDVIGRCLEPKGTLVLVCGDNLIAGQRIPTWRILAGMLADRQFCLFDSFKDRIADRLLPPKRCGHKGLIKDEVVLAFKRRW